MFGVDESDSDEASNDSDTDSTEVCIFWVETFLSTFISSLVLRLVKTAFLCCTRAPVFVLLVQQQVQELSKTG